MRYVLTIAATAVALAVAAPAFAAGETIHGAGCGFSAARLAQLTTPQPVAPAKATVAQIDQVLALPQIAVLLPMQPKPAAQR